MQSKFFAGDRGRWKLEKILHKITEKVELETAAQRCFYTRNTVKFGSSFGSWIFCSTSPLGISSSVVFSCDGDIFANGHKYIRCAFANTVCPPSTPPPPNWKLCRIKIAFASLDSKCLMASSWIAAMSSSVRGTLRAQPFPRELWGSFR